MRPERTGNDPERRSICSESRCASAALYPRLRRSWPQRWRRIDQRGLSIPVGFQRVSSVAALRHTSQNSWQFR